MTETSTGGGGLLEVNLPYICLFSLLMSDLLFVLTFSFFHLYIFQNQSSLGSCCMLMSSFNIVSKRFPNTTI